MRTRHTRNRRLNWTQRVALDDGLTHDVTFPLFVAVDEIYNLACPAAPIHYQYDPVQTTKTSVHGAINMLGLAKRVQEKPDGDGAWINGGYFVLEPTVFENIEGDGTSWETGPLQALAAKGQLAAYQHRGFWQAMDTLRDKNQLESLWAGGNAPWKVWE